MYDSEMPSAAIFPTKYKMWVAKWKTHESECPNRDIRKKILRSTDEMEKLVRIFVKMHQRRMKLRFFLETNDI